MGNYSNSIETKNDDFDIYADLELDDVIQRVEPIQEQVRQNVVDDLYEEAIFGGQLHSLEREVKQLREFHLSLTQENEALKNNLASKEKQVQILKNNISSLYKTAKVELDRRCNELNELRREYDNFIVQKLALEQKKQRIDDSVSPLNPSFKVEINNGQTEIKPMVISSAKENHREYTQNYQDKPTFDMSFNYKRKQSPLSEKQNVNYKNQKYEFQTTPKSRVRDEYGSTKKERTYSVDIKNRLYNSFK